MGAFGFYALGLVFVAVNALLVKIFYARQDMKTPVIAGAAAALTNIALNLALVGPLQQRGLALATSIAAFVNTAALFVLLRKKHPEVRVVESRAKTAKILAAALASVAVSWPVYIGLGRLANLHVFVSLGAAVAAAASAYLLLLKLLKIEELSLLGDLVRRRESR